MKKIVHVITGLDAGGTERALLAMLPRLREMGLQQRVFCILGEGLIGKELIRQGIPVTYLGYSKWYDVLRISVLLFTMLRRETPDVLVTYLIHADLFGRIIGKLAGVKKIVSYKRGSLLSWEFLQYAEWMTKKLVTHYIVVSDELRDVLEHRLSVDQRKISHIRNGIDISIYEKATSDRKRVRDELNLEPEDITIGIIAKLRPGKGHRGLFESFQSVIEQRRDLPLRLIVVGDGSQEQYLKRHAHNLGIEEKTIFTGYQQEIPSILSALDIFVLPTQFEGMSLALLEAMASQKPIITTNIRANLEVVDESCALLIPPSDTDALTEAIITMASDAELRKALAQRAYMRCKNHHSLDRVVREYFELLYAIA